MGGPVERDLGRTVGTTVEGFIDWTTGAGGNTGVVRIVTGSRPEP